MQVLHNKSEEMKASFKLYLTRSTLWIIAGNSCFWPNFRGLVWNDRLVSDLPGQQWVLGPRPRQALVASILCAEMQVMLNSAAKLLIFGNFLVASVQSVNDASVLHDLSQSCGFFLQARTKLSPADEAAGESSWESKLLSRWGCHLDRERRCSYNKLLEASAW